MTDTLETPGDSEDLGFDPEALRARYRAERDKRLRADGTGQYQDISVVGGWRDDPYVEPGFTRDPLTDEVEVVVIGGGFGGMLTAARLREAGVDDIRIIEKGGDFGGTWYWNRYPGAACDVESYIYLPLLEEVGYVPTEKYAKAPEILAHSQAIGRHFDLYPSALFQTEVTEVRWDEAISRWIITTNRGDAIRARFVAMANGPLNKPKLPGIPGVETFKGRAFHTSRWDYAYTGGDTYGGLSGLAGKRVGVIGTGATAVQCVPHLGAAAAELFVFQRTPSSIDVRNNRPTDPEWAANLEPGWQKRRMDNFNILLAGGYQEEDLVSDGWTDVVRSLVVESRKKAGPGASGADIGALMQVADFRKMEQIRARVDEMVADPATAEALKPYYNQFCKRPCFHDEYLETFNRPNVHLIDTQGQGVERITEKGVVANGVEYELDCLIYATGFEWAAYIPKSGGYDVVGRDGQTLLETWADGARTLHGFHSRGFPNFFVLSNVQGGFTANFPHILSEQAKHIAYVVSECARRQVKVAEVSADAEAEWVETIERLAVLRRKFLEDCTPGYYNNEGNVQAMSVRNSAYGAGPVAFIQVLEDWRAEGTLKGLELN